ncbi:hypothetical protein Natoc_4113 (plasmid) [Natronococcus occultus SP4]|uniref:Uncharacterized protein n=1 Tax=Natronococcus occultus SP4 TaxID=694430 RepID=L0K646_9EURY|nr:hypothetical protein Natoc_4113 [Natronococcus occultus SP4]
MTYHIERLQENHGWCRRFTRNRGFSEFRYMEMRMEHW